jgi:hypothetical protein
VRVALKSRRVQEKEMFGGIGLLLRGNMACGVLGKDLLVRVGPEGQDESLKSRHARPFVMSGAPAKGWVLIRPAGVKSDTELRVWIEMGVACARVLPAK